MVTTGGLAVIASILGILVFLFWEIAPLLRGADVELESPIPITSRAAALLVAFADWHAIAMVCAVLVAMLAALTRRRWLPAFVNPRLPEVDR